MVAGLIFDGDDTLWRTERLYDDARAAARSVVEARGLDGAKWEEIERRIDVERVATLGHDPERFPGSCVEAYREICAIEGILPRRREARLIRRKAQSVFKRDAVVFEDARDTLERLRDRSVRLALLTKGEAMVQRRRMARSGLNDLFQITEVVPDKTPGVIASVTSRLGSDFGATAMVGNSVRSDLLPALAAGIGAIWIERPVWEYERASDHLVDARIVQVRALSGFRY